jgi:tetratricopeptide (TPR) repeat protein
MAWTRNWFSAWVLCALVGATAAQDQKRQEGVKLKGSRIIYRGVILRYDDRGVSIRWMPRGEVKEFALDEVEEVMANWPEGYPKGKKLLEEGNYSEAAAELRAALAGEERVWAQEHMRNDLLRALRALGDVEGTADMFVKAISYRRDAAIMAYAPLRWVPGPPLTPRQLSAARTWMLAGDDPPVRLLGANWLMQGDEREKAKAVLESLRTDPDGRVRPLARAMLIADLLRANPKALSKEDLAEFRQEVVGLPNAVRIGPQFVLATAYERAGESTKAAFAYLTVPYVLGGPPELQAEALRRAATCSRSASMPEDAARLEAELLKRFPETSAARALKSKSAAK